MGLVVKESNKSNTPESYIGLAESTTEVRLLCRFGCENAVEVASSRWENCVRTSPGTRHGEFDIRGTCRRALWIIVAELGRRDNGVLECARCTVRSGQRRGAQRIRVSTGDRERRLRFGTDFVRVGVIAARRLAVGSIDGDVSCAAGKWHQEQK